MDELDFGNADFPVVKNINKLRYPFRQDHHGKKSVMFQYQGTCVNEIVQRSADFVARNRYLCMWADLSRIHLPERRIADNEVLRVLRRKMILFPEIPADKRNIPGISIQFLIFPGEIDQVRLNFKPEYPAPGKQFTQGQRYVTGSGSQFCYPGEVSFAFADEVDKKNGFL